MQDQDRVVVVGAGIIGLSIAWRAAQVGLAVTVLEGDEAPRGASWVAAGMLAPVTEAAFGEDSLLRLNLESASRYPAFVNELSELTGIELRGGIEGTLFVALDRDQSESLRRLFNYQHSLGLKVSWLSTDSCRKLEPALHPSVRSAVLAEGDWAVDPRALSQALRKALELAGVQINYSSPVAAIAAEPGSGVILRDGQKVPANQIVLAAGAWSGKIEGVPTSIGASVRPVKGQILRLRPPAGEPCPASHVIRTEEVYIVPRATGELVVGATVEEKGFDTALTAGAIFELLRAAQEVLPAIREMELVECQAGLRPGTPDNGPLLGTCKPNLIAATGHYRNGVLLAPVTADAISQLLANGETPPEIAPFSPLRFAS